MDKHRARLIAAALGPLLMQSFPGGRVITDIEDDAPRPAASKANGPTHPYRPSGKRQGARVARQVARSLGDPFAASNACIARINERLGK